MSKISELSDGGSLQSTDYLIAVRSGGNVKVQPNGTVTGTTGSFSGNVTFADNAKAIFGAGSDLQIYHDGSNSYVQDAGTGNLFLQGTDLQLRANNSMRYLTAVQAAEVKLYYNNSQKLATTATGIDVTGTVTADGLTVSGSGAVGSFDRTDANAIIELKRSGSLQGYIGASTGGDVILYNASAAQKLRAADNGDISFYEDTGTTAKFFWDASAEYLGVGTTTPSQTIEARSATLAAMRVRSDTGSITDFGSDATGTYWKNFTAASNTYRWLQDDNTESMRIDSSGNLLVGKTSADFGATAGVELRNDGRVATGRAGESAVFNRLTSDGDIALFRKDGTTVGSIGTLASRLFIGSDDTFLTFQGASDRIYPALSSGGVRDAAIDLGYSSGRFKDLYLSGGVYLGGTGAANQLDDYEEGDWTPVFEGTTSGSKDLGAIGRYTKIGRVVHAVFYASNADFSTAAIVGTVELSGLPFNIASLGQGLGIIAINNLITGGSDYVPYPYSGDTLRFSAGTTSQLTDAGLTQSASRFISLEITYIAA